MSDPCTHCDSFNFQGEAVNNEFTACCNKGSIKLPALIGIPDEIKKLYTGKIYSFYFKIIISLSLFIK
jgi:hypothetical protein